MPVLWVLWGIGVVNIAALFVSVVVYEIRARLMEVGPACLASALAIAAIATTFVGGFSGLLLILRTDAGAVLVVGTVVLLAGAAFVTAFALHQVWLSRRVSRIGKRLLSRKEMLDLIRAGLVRSFTRRHGVLDVSLDPRANKHCDLWERRAHPEDYLVFVAAADELLAEGRVIYYDDETGQGPSSINYRWITFEEAAALLGADKVSKFVYGRGADPGDGRTAFRGTPTGIGLADYGWGRRIEVAPAQAAALVPLARAAQATHRRLQFWVDGSWEPTAGRA